MNEKPVTDTEIFLEWSENAEMSLLSVMMLKPDLIDEISVKLAPEEVYGHSNQILYKTICKINQTYPTCDGTILMEELLKDGKIEELGGFEAIRERLEYCGYPSLVYDYIDKIKERHAKRTFRQMCNDGLEKLKDPTETFKDLSSWCVEVLDSIEYGKEIKTDAASGLVRMMQALDKKEAMIQTGFSELDAMIGGFKRGQAIYIAARPGMGKTAFAVNILSNMAKSGIAVLFFELEMEENDIRERWVSSEGEIYYSNFLPNAVISPETYTRIGTVAQELSQYPFYVLASNRLTLSEIESYIRKHIRDYQVACVCIDYFGIISTPGNERSLYEKATKMANDLKEMARRLNVVLIVLSQLNREVESSNNKKPQMSHLRDSGALEQSADIIMLLHRENYYDEDKDPYLAEVIVPKNRNGKRGKVDLRWEGEFVSFRDAPQSTSQESVETFPEFNRFSGDSYTPYSDTESF